MRMLISAQPQIEKIFSICYETKRIGYCCEFKKFMAVNDLWPQTNIMVEAMFIPFSTEEPGDSYYRTQYFVVYEHTIMKWLGSWVIANIFVEFTTDKANLLFHRFITG